MNGRSRVLWLSVPTAVIAIYFAIGFWMAYYFPVSGFNEVFQLVNSATGPFSGVIASNFLYDGFSNVIVFGIFTGIFLVTGLLLPIKVLRGRTVFLLLGMFTVPWIPEVLSRIYLRATVITGPAGTITITNIAYGQSGVLSAAMGIIFIFTLLTITRGQWIQRLSFLGGLTYSTILGVLMGIEVLLFSGLFTTDWATEIVHLGSLIGGAALTVVYYLLTERSSPAREKTAYLIPASKVKA